MDNDRIGIRVSLSGIFASEDCFVGITTYLASAPVSFDQFLCFGFRDYTFVIIIFPRIIIAKSTLTSIEILHPQLFKFVGISYA